MIHVPNDVLRRAIILPKDMDTTGGRYATPKDLLPKNPANDIEYIHKQENYKKVMKDLIKWQQNTFPWRRNPEDDEGKGGKTKDKKTKDKKTKDKKTKK